MPKEDCNSLKSLDKMSGWQMTVTNDAEKASKPEKPLKNAENDGKMPLSGEENVEKKVAEMQKQLVEMTELVQRTQAEFENFQKRSEREKPVLISSGQLQTLLAFLPLYESLEHALEKAGEPEKKTLEPLNRQFRQTFEKLGVKEMISIGKPFDPTEQDGLLSASDKTKPDGIVLEEIQKGFFWHNQVLRHAKVKINRWEST